MKDNRLAQYLLELNLEISAEEGEKFDIYLKELTEWNSKINLTAIHEEEDIIIKHFYDSLLGMAVPGWTGQGKLLDMGTGAGFPGLPLRIINPDLEVILVDSLQKRVAFLQKLIERLGITKAAAIHGRAEELGQNSEHREVYDLVVSRAVARLPVLAEYCLPLVKRGGRFLAYKGPEGKTECQEAEKALTILGGTIRDIHSFNLPQERGERNIIEICKLKATPAQYPRRPGQPQKKPL